jgi:hypothetical protein
VSDAHVGHRRQRQLDPLAATQQVEILRRLRHLGTDAVAGVVNAVLKKDHQGSHLLRGGPYAGDAEDWSLVFGHLQPEPQQRDVLYNIFYRDELPAADRDFAASADKEDRG